jgi:hypothetical protein
LTNIAKNIIFAKYSNFNFHSINNKKFQKTGSSILSKETTEYKLSTGSKGNQTPKNKTSLHGSLGIFPHLGKNIGL